jgi:uncharacterized caspase-like protein
MPRLTTALLFLFGMFSLLPPAIADRRVALVIGNANYAHVSKVEGGDRDARAIAKMLEEAGFETGEPLVDAGLDALRAGLRGLSRRAEGADLAVVYYAGHGIQVNGTNYVVPVDGKLERDIDVTFETIALDQVLLTIEPARFLRLVIVDACRDNPFAQSLRRHQSTRAVSRGLAPLSEPRALPNDTVVVYATRAEKTCAVSPDGSNPFVSALLHHLPTPGVDIFRALQRVRQEVMTKTNGHQEPGIYGSFGSESVFLVQRDDAASDFRLARQAGTPQALRAFLAKHQRGPEADEARALLARLDHESPVAAALARGKSYALIIGNQDYKDPAFPRLETPHADARAVAAVLTNQYGFITRLPDKNGREADLVLLDATANDIGDALDGLAATLGRDDRVLVYFAGHGIYEKETETAYWVPSDARNGRTRDLLAASEITRALRRVPARSVLVVSDSCYSGVLFREWSSDPSPTDTEREHALIKLAERPSRVLIASGGTEPVLDGGGSGHSIFARKFLEALRSPRRPAFSALELYTENLRPAVAGNAQQTPQYATLRDSGHDIGDFVFVATPPKGVGK